MEPQETCEQIYFMPGNLVKIKQFELIIKHDEASFIHYRLQRF
jgi:hypothetical protein